ncbi:hypothetical protein TVAG_051340 [Trichomonas vaginalis G3]|uniref:Uncharacterized protein n=2 Tax=Trichomonas vaginalis (strain ATCC PRA-98 / G3) TaxID=412133 RepID=A2FZQ6_TRIV3|nr:hypothetical protein TVAG_051340 [Trichomonas vaginalis G3]|eukprot:XP_001302542.1 hypothetical protein [Trichomonas vaginalis G3]
MHHIEPTTDLISFNVYNDDEKNIPVITLLLYDGIKFTYYLNINQTSGEESSIVVNYDSSHVKPISYNVHINHNLHPNYYHKLDTYKNSLVYTSKLNDSITASPTQTPSPTPNVHPDPTTTTSEMTPEKTPETTSQDSDDKQKDGKGKRIGIILGSTIAVIIVIVVIVIIVITIIKKNKEDSTGVVLEKLV